MSGYEEPEEEYSEYAPRFARATAEGAEVTVDLDLGAIVGDIREEVIARAVSVLTEKIERDVQAEVIRRVSGVIDAKLGEIVTSLVEREYRPVDEFGYGRGDPTTMQAEIVKRAKDYMETLVDTDGKVSPYEYHNKTPRWEFYCRRILGSAWTTLAQKVADEYSKQIRARLDAGMAQVMAESIKIETK